MTKKNRSNPLVGKALAHIKNLKYGPGIKLLYKHSAVAKKQIQQLVKDEVRKEMSRLSSIYKQPTVSRESLQESSWSDLMRQYENKAPLTYAVMLAALCKKTKETDMIHRPDKSKKSRRPRLGMMLAIPLFNRNESRFQFFQSVFSMRAWLEGGNEKLLKIGHSLGLCLSDFAAVRSKAEAISDLCATQMLTWKRKNKISWPVLSAEQAASMPANLDSLLDHVIEPCTDEVDDNQPLEEEDESEDSGSDSETPDAWTEKGPVSPEKASPNREHSPSRGRGSCNQCGITVIEEEGKHGWCSHCENTVIEEVHEKEQDADEEQDKEEDIGDYMKNPIVIEDSNDMVVDAVENIDDLPTILKHSKGEAVMEGNSDNVVVLEETYSDNVVVLEDVSENQVQILPEAQPQHPEHLPVLQEVDEEATLKEIFTDSSNNSRLVSKDAGTLFVGEVQVQISDASGLKQTGQHLESAHQNQQESLKAVKILMQLHGNPQESSQSTSAPAQAYRTTQGSSATFNIPLHHAYGTTRKSLQSTNALTQSHGTTQKYSHPHSILKTSHPYITYDNPSGLKRKDPPESTNTDHSESTTNYPSKSTGKKKARFQSYSSEELQQFKHKQGNKKTTEKTICHVKLFHEFLLTKDDERKMHEIPPVELDELIGEFLVSIRKIVKDDPEDEEYEPATLTAMFCSFSRHLMANGYGITLSKDPRFARARDLLAAKVRELKAKGKGKKKKVPTATLR